MRCKQQPMGWFLPLVPMLMPSRGLATIDRQHDELKAGGGIPDMLLAIFIVFVITGVPGVTNLFPFIHPTG